MGVQGVEPFDVEVTAAQVADLRERLRRTRWPDQLPGTGWQLGTDSVALRQLCDYWADGYDFDAFLARWNVHRHVRADVDGTVVHALVAPSDLAAATPLLLLHGWPGSVAEYYDVIEPLRRDHHVVVASLPGYGFSGPTTQPGVDHLQVARVLVELMRRLGHDRFVVAGGDWGATVGAWMAAYLPEALLGLHMTMVPIGLPDPRTDDTTGVTDREWQEHRRAEDARATDVGYAMIQATRPQSLAYGLTDSPAGLAGWIVEKFHGWSDGGLAAVPRDRLLDNLSIYWFTGTINSSMRLYRESHPLFPDRPVGVPTGVAAYPADIYPVPRVWAERHYHIVRWRVMPRGGHFASMEVPDLYAADLAEFVAELSAG